ncbi:MAG: hypothetical protein MTP17_04440 [Candidatus Midichloria sp.]|nr:MAG: hypothetical protein MTP17_04440 [Candidatus Midichloria sp.]
MFTRGTDAYVDGKIIQNSKAVRANQTFQNYEYENLRTSSMLVSLYVENLGGAAATNSRLITSCNKELADK